MSERDGFEPGVPCWVAHVSADPASAVDFYSELFGWEAENLMPPDHPGDYFLCRLRGRDVAAIVSQHGAPAPPSAIWTTHIEVERADETAAKVAESGGSIIGAFDSPGGGRQAVVADPAGAAFCLWEPRERKGAQLVNEPSAWAMSALNTPDPEGSKQFYAAVFGWGTETFDLGEAEMTMWTVPGYVGGEPQQPVPREVVATMAPPGGDGADQAPPHWSVDFWIRDVDAAATEAGERGGRVIAGPYEIPNTGLRQAALVDPQGATFSLTQPPGV
jgi:uncharacterized protein